MTTGVEAVATEASGVKVTAAVESVTAAMVGGEAALTRRVESVVAVRGYWRGALDWSDLLLLKLALSSLNWRSEVWLCC